MPSIIPVRKQVFHRAASQAVAPPSEQTVLFDASGIYNNSSVGVVTANLAPVTNSIAVGSGSNGTTNLCLVQAAVFIGAASGTSSGVSMTWDASGAGGGPQPMTQFASFGAIFMFYLMNPHLGQLTTSISWTGSNQVNVVSGSFVNVDQTGGATTFPNNQSASGNSTGPASVSISTSPTTRKMFAAFDAGGTILLGSPVNGTAVGPANNTGNTLDCGGSWDNGTATSMGYGFTSGTGVWEALAAVIKGHP